MYLAGFEQATPWKYSHTGLTQSRSLQFPLNFCIDSRLVYVSLPTFHSLEKSLEPVILKCHICCSRQGIRQKLSGLIGIQQSLKECSGHAHTLHKDRREQCRCFIPQNSTLPLLPRYYTPTCIGLRGLCPDTPKRRSISNDFVTLTQLPS